MTEHHARLLALPIADRLPLPGNAARAQLGFDRIAGGPAVLQRLAESSDGRAFLAAIFGNSPFLGQLLFSESDIVEAFLTQDAAAVLADLLAGLTGAGLDGDATRLMRSLRQARRRAAQEEARQAQASWSRWPISRGNGNWSR